MSVCEYLLIYTLSSQAQAHQTDWCAEQCSFKDLQSQCGIEEKDKSVVMPHETCKSCKLNDNGHLLKIFI